MVSTLLKSTLLVILIALVLGGGLVFFDWMGLVSLRQEFGSALSLVGFNAPTSENSSSGKGTELNDARLREQLESLGLNRQNLEDLEKRLAERSDELAKRELEISQVEKQLQEQLQALEERENLYLARNVKIEQIARNFNGMPPAQAVGQMNEMDALLLVDILRAADRIAAEEATTSLVPFWVSQMPAARGAEINKLLVEKP